MRQEFLYLSDHQPVLRSRGALVVVGLAACLALGCGGQKPVGGPPTVPAQGRIEFTKGGSPQSLAEASVVVEFQSVEQPDMKAFGVILEDGSFTMKTQVGDETKEGVVAGTHRVRLNADDSGTRYIAPKYLRHETSGLTVKLPSDGPLVIKVQK